MNQLLKNAILSFLVSLVLSPLFISHCLAQSFGTGSFGVPSFGSPGGVRGGFGSAPAAGRAWSRTSSATADGMGGFTFRTPQGATRYFPKPAGSGTLHHPDGSRSIVIEDGNGNFDISGPYGRHKVFGEPKWRDGSQ